MSPTPLWKIKRELLRPIHQLLNLPYNLATRLFGALYFDLFKKLQSHTGEQAIKTKVAIFVIFPKKGVVKSSYLRTLSHLNKNTYSVIIVSNAPLENEAVNTLKPKCAQLIIRPNFGYDFGGYRQGILFLLEQKTQFSRLLLLNDSCWFPTFYELNWIQIAEEKNLDLVGVTSNYGIEKRWDQKGGRTANWEYLSSHNNFHYCSFALLFSEKIIYHSSFIKFWKRFPLTNKKSKVVRRGEIGLTRLVLSGGFSHGETFSIQNLPGRLNNLAYDDLLSVFLNLIIPEDRDLQRDHELAVRAGTFDRDYIENFILRSVARQGAVYGLAFFINVFREAPFLKKSPFLANKNSRESLVKCLGSLPSEVAEEILSEIALIDNS